VVVLGYSLVSSSITKPGTYSASMPAIEAAGWRRIVARLRHLDELFDRVRLLERRGGPSDAEHS
jgi:UDP-3-O-[3-hydroxymyristoyl] glucosamine N-acyltransferase